MSSETRRWALCAGLRRQASTQRRDVRNDEVVERVELRDRRTGILQHRRIDVGRFRPQPTRRLPPPRPLTGADDDVPAPAACDAAGRAAHNGATYAMT